jgi:FKBP-type peptidyl-prolyl cis-trans isomerase
MRLIRFLLGTRHRLPEAPRPRWLNILIIVFLLYALSVGMRPEPDGTPSELQQKIDKVGETFSEENIDKTLDVYRSALFPSYSALLEMKDTKLGKGQGVLCGQTATIAYRASVYEGRALSHNATASAPLVFTLGNGDAIPALEQGVTGMRVGGKRTILALPSMSYGIKKFSDGTEKLTSPELVQLDVELLAVTPEAPNLSALPFRIFHRGEGKFVGGPSICGQTVKVHATIWDMAGNKLFSTPENKPLSITLGKGEVFLGLEQGIIGLPSGAQRTLIVPPALQGVLEGRKPTMQFPLPEGQTVLVDVETLP